MTSPVHDGPRAPDEDEDPVVLVTARSFGSGALDPLARLRQEGYRPVRAGSRHSLEELRPLLARAVGWIAGTGPVTAEHLAAAPSLRVLARYGVGVDAVDLAAAQARGVVVTNTPGANSAAVAEHALALLLAALRGVPAADRRVRSGDWSPRVGRELSALTVGVVGLGRVGRGVTQLLRGFGCRLLGHDPWLPPDDPVFGAVTACGTERMAVEADVVTLHAPGGQCLVDRSWLERSRRPLLLVNTARADLVDEQAAAESLRSGRLSAFAADTLAVEATGTRRSPLLAEDLADRVVVTPHLGAQTRESVDAMGRTATDDLLAVLAGGEPQHRVRESARAVPR
ncbi:NAD(P)-dependent oxidoreductase [Kineococcus esterisolvens]|uniref:NAD(P)-dependent oxidoreductase n=1 Tax=unclassified Kineococcus TaxID=2621656 RepID=UPI003D7D590D